VTSAARTRPCPRDAVIRGEVLAAVQAARDERDGRPVPGQGEGGRLADARARAGHQGGRPARTGVPDGVTGAPGVEGLAAVPRGEVDG
jgi:hypothetical protein